jgi:N-methylhydantoinase A/oxoprolinase/acetone carboxylase beta subunit
VNGYDWERIRPGDVIQGPAIVWTPNTTIVFRSADKAEMDERLNLVLTPSGSPLREETNGHDN